MRLITTTRFHRGKLPHWEIANGRYFITVRLADSLPAHVVLRLHEIHRSLSRVEPRSHEFADMQRRYFETMERYLSAGYGSCLLQQGRLASVVASELDRLNECDTDVRHFCIMPNHWHCLIEPSKGAPPLMEIMKRVKGRSGKAIRQIAGGQGPVWQREWFDRWIRNDGDLDTTIAYIQQNPVVAGLVPRWQDHAWTR